ncbi:MAG: outer membrane protein assembly factor BamC, partial [Chromatiales bacterium]|nr:outer membrane protein assembly factor BamC [Chromatiales bacterium]
MFNALRLLALSLLFLLSACSGGGTNSRIDYKEAKSLRTLATPPDLVVPVNNGTAELPEMGGEQAILPAVRGMRMERDGAERWLVSDTPAEELWPRLRGFWTTIGLELNLDLPQVGIMETNWAENRADAPGGFLTELVKSVFRNAYSAGTRDRYRLRLERRDNGGSEIFLTHYGLKEVVVPSRDGVSDNTRWEVRPSDPELVAEVNSRLLMHLGYSESSAKALQVESEKVDRAYLEGDGLVINEGFARSWRRTGIALDRLGVVVEDRDRSRGIYYVVEVDLLPEEKKGWLGSIFSS